MTNSSSHEPVDLSDPAVEPLRLQELAQTHPQLWDEILQHPNVYPGLADWIRDRKAEQAAQAPSQPAQEPVEELADDESTEPAAGTDPATAAEPEQFSAPAWAQPSGGSTGEQQAETPAGGWFQNPIQPGDEPTTAFGEPESHSETAQPAWGGAEPSPGASSPQSEPQPFGQPSPFEQPAQQEPQWSQQPTSGFEQHSGQQSFGYAQTGQQPFGQPQQPGFGQSQQYYGQPQFGASPRNASKIDMSDRGTWGLFVAGGAAFLSLFGFFFTPSTTAYALADMSHVAAGGWVILLLLIATVALAVLELLLPSKWMRYSFIVVSIGAGFALLARCFTLIGFLGTRGSSFSVVWLIFMALVLLAGAMLYLAARIEAGPSATQPRAAQPQPYQATAHQQPGQYPQGGYGQHQGGYPQGGQPGGPQQFGGYQPPQQPGSPQ